MKGILRIVLSIAILTFVSDSCLAWNNNFTHRYITNRSLDFETIDLSNLIAKQFGNEGGLNLYVDGKPLNYHLLEGSEFEDNYEGTTTFQEDYGYADNPVGFRAFRHFHDPLRPFSDAGLRDVSPTNLSAVVWAEDRQENKWDLRDFYAYMKESFTLPTENERLASLAKTFRTAGHLMHLLQDMAVPAHVRDELFGGHTLLLKMDIPPVTSPFEYFVQTRPHYVQNVEPTDIPSFETFTDYYDTGSYRALNTLPVSGPLYGLAEYTNSNFFSELQYFSRNGPGPVTPYPNPNLSDVYYWDKKIDTSLFYPHLIPFLPPVFYSAYIGRESLHPDQNISFLARVGFFDKYRIDPEGNGAFFLDKACWAEYARKLLPKAVAYSAGLLEFLFRADIDFEVEPDTSRLIVRNESTRSMSGLFELYYDASDGTRRKLDGHEWRLSIPAGASIAAPAEVSLPRDMGVDRTVTLVFHGTLGTAEGVVTGMTHALSDLEFTSLQAAEYAEIIYPSPYSQFTGTADPDRSWYHYRCKVDYQNSLSNATVNRATNFYLKIRSTPDIAKKLGHRYTPGQWFYLLTSPSSAGVTVESFRIETAPGEWSYLFDISGLNRDDGRAHAGYPVSYNEGLFGSETGYMGAYHALGAGANRHQQCVFEDSVPATPDTVINLYYDRVGDPPQWQPECVNADSIIALAEGYCDSYLEFYYYSLKEAQPYLPALYNSEWAKFGFEVKFARLIAANPARGDGVIYDGPVTIVKPYGSNDVTAY